MSYELKKCPFCGGTAHITAKYSHKRGWFALISCPVCFAQSKVSNISGDDEPNLNDERINSLVESWNMRVGADNDQ